MSKLGLFLDLAGLAVSANNAMKLEEMRQQGADAAAVQTIINVLRNEIFKFKEASEAILEVEEKDPKLAAGAMRLLQEQVSDSGIEPELFFDLSDKEYASKTIRLINKESERLVSQLPPADVKEIDRLIETVSPLDDYSYYLTHYDKTENLHQNIELAEKYGQGAGCLVKIGILMYFYPGLLLPASFVITFSNWFGLLLSLLACGAWAYGLYRLIKWMPTRQSENARKHLQKLEKQVDIKRLALLDIAYEGNRATIQGKLDEAQLMIKEFFGDSQYLLN